MSAPKSQATKAAKAQVSNVADFKKRKKGQPLPLPSGLTMICRRVELTSFLEKGDVPNPLMQIIDEALSKGKEMNVDQLVGANGQGINLDMVNEMFEMVNQVVQQVVLEPKVHPVPEDEADRDDDLLYIDEVDPEDKMFIFQWSIGGPADLERFRKEAGADMAALAQIQGGGS